MGRQQVFPALIPYRKWKVEYRNPLVGDVVLVHYPSRISKGDYRLARIVAVHPDHHGVTRTVTVAMRPRDVREKVSSEPPYLAPKPPVELQLGIQRIAVVLPVEEQEDGLGTATQGPTDKSDSDSLEIPSPEQLDQSLDEPFLGFNVNDVTEARPRKEQLADMIQQEHDFFRDQLELDTLVKDIRTDEPPLTNL